MTVGKEGAAWLADDYRKDIAELRDHLKAWESGTFSSDMSSATGWPGERTQATIEWIKRKIAVLEAVLENGTRNS